MGNEQVIRWISGPASGFYIDLTRQHMGFGDSQISLEYLQAVLLSYMLKNREQYITAQDVKKSNDLFSINLSKYISEIKKRFKKITWGTDEIDPENLFEQVIDKQTVNGKLGYRLRTELTDYEKAPEEDRESTPATLQKPVQETPDRDAYVFPEDGKGHLRISDYFSKNWFPLFIYGFLILSGILLSDAYGYSPIKLIGSIIEAPFWLVLICICVLSTLPVLGGLFLDVPISLRTYCNTKNIDKNSLTSSMKHDIVMYRVPRFDNSKENVSFFLTSNLTGAFTAVAAILYARNLPTISIVTGDPKHNTAFIITFIAGCFVALYNNFMLQVKIPPTRCPDDFILSRVHAFLNLIYLSVVISVGAGTLYAILVHRFFCTGTTHTISTGYIVMLLSMYCFLWFSSDSPKAEAIDSVSKNNFLAGIPSLAVFTYIYVALCFKPDFICFTVLVLNTLFVGVWLIYLLRRKKANSLRLQGIYTSFFSVMAGIVLALLLLNLSAA